jgi:hypothetical protein
MAAWVSAPFLAPWPVRVRFLAATPMVDPWTGIAPAERLHMRAVTLESVEAERGQVDLVVDGLGAHCRLRSRESCAPFVVAELDGWSASHMPLLMVIEEDRGVDLYGPHSSVTDFVLTGEKVR